MEESIRDGRYTVEKDSEEQRVRFVFGVEVVTSFYDVPIVSQAHQGAVILCTLYNSNDAREQ